MKFVKQISDTLVTKSVVWQKLGLLISQFNKYTVYYVLSMI